MKELEPVSLDMIRRLKLNGRRVEANRMLETYQENLRKERKQDRKETENIKCKIRNYKYRQKARDKGLCESCGQRPPAKGRTACNRCLFLASTRQKNDGSVYSYKSLGKDNYEVLKDDKFAYSISLNPLHCDCRGFVKNKMCKHIRFVLAQLEEKGGIL